MTKKYKPTGCARFFVFLVIFVPAVYFGINYLNDTGKLDEIREKVEDFDIGNGNAVDKILKKQNKDKPISSDIEEKIENLLSIIERQKDKIEEQEDLLIQFEKTIQAQNDKIQILEGTEKSVKADSSIEASEKEKKKTSLEELLREADEAIKNNRKNN